MNNEEVYDVEVLPRRRWAYPRDNERNYVAAFFHAVSAVLTTISLVDLTWFRTFGDLCSPYFCLYQFMRLGYFETSTQDGTMKLTNGEIITSPQSSITIEYHSGNESMFIIRLLYISAYTQ